MILVFSQHSDESTNQVLDCIYSQSNVKVLRLNTEDFLLENLKMKVGDNFLIVNGEVVNFNDVKVVWFRRWYDYGFLNEKLSPLILKNNTLGNQLRRFTIKESNVLFGYLFSCLNKSYWLSKPEDNDINKLKVLNAALDIGFKIPETILTNREKNLEKGDFITKSIGDSSTYDFNGEEFTFYTEKIDIDKVGESFFPSMFQNLIKKEFEIRSFYLNRKVYSIAIFSQNNKNTSIDYRHYDSKTPNYYTKFQLPQKIEDKIYKLMDLLSLETGSLDLIKSIDGEYYFLEVNPIGQFGFVSYHGGYNLEQLIANYLVKKHYEG